MKTVLVTPELAGASTPGNLGTFAWEWSRLLRQAGEDVHLILTRPPRRPSRAWRQPYDDLGITLDVLEEPEHFIALPHGYRLHQRMAEVVSERLPPDTDIVYYAERDANGMHHLRRRRFSGARLPVVATVLHGGSSWQLENALRWPSRLEDVQQDFYERYVVAHSDWVIAPTQAMLGWVTQAGWCLPASERVRVAGYPCLPDHEAAASPAQAAPEPTSSLDAKRFRRLICYSMPAATEDFALFAQALDRLRDKLCLDAVKEVVLLGCAEDAHPRPEDPLQALRQAVPGRSVTARLEATPAAARALLAELAPDGLVVVARRAAGMECEVVAASLVPEIHLLCASAGGMAEIVGEGPHLCEPFPAPLARALERRLLEGPRGASASGAPPGYAWRAANERWLSLHREIAAEARALRDEATQALPPAPGARQHDRGAATPAPVSATLAASAPPQPTRSVDVCIPYYNLGAYLPALLEALDQQTSQAFNVFLVNDGSTDAASKRIFEEMMRAYADHPHWHFVTTENQGVCAARNLAASLGTADYVCFVDADNIPLPSMIERFLASIRQSGDDCLTCYLYVIEREGDFTPGFDPRQRPLVHYLPVGNCLTLGVFTNPFGDINCIMRRAVFEAVGGFTMDYPNAINHEDRELLTRLAFAGYRLDVIPEFLCSYRQRAGSRLRTTDQYLNDGRVMRVYLQQLRASRTADLAALAPLALGLLHRDDQHSAQYGTAPPDPNLLHTLTFEASAVVLAKALARRLRHHLRARWNRPHRTP